MSIDLFGERPESSPIGPKLGPKGGKHYTAPKGYAASPGTGPAGKTCHDCAHYVIVCGGVRSFPKCALAEARWTHGRGSDILVRSPACVRFEQKA
jgi:hypothetical protein